jgi:hypothetical protein
MGLGEDTVVPRICATFEEITLSFLRNLDTLSTWTVSSTGMPSCCSLRANVILLCWVGQRTGGNSAPFSRSMTVGHSVPHSGRAAILWESAALIHGFNVQFRADIFNILNHPNFALPVSPDNTDIFDSTVAPLNPPDNDAAGVLKSTTTKSREIQFALKVIW